MDSQGVFDEYTDFRDWSTIVGIPLLTSSIFIYNIFADIQESDLTNLEPVLNYAQIAIENEQIDKKSKPFQKLVKCLLSIKKFLILLSFSAIFNT